jgi:hypothetical protein
MSKTILEKNVAIALMMGATTDQWYPPNKDNNSTGLYLNFTKDWWPDNRRYYGDYGLKFHSDANWQDEAMKFLEKKLFFFVAAPFTDDETGGLSGEYWCQVLKGTTNINYNPLVDICGQPSKKLAIFEALYEMSQLVKNPMFLIPDESINT